MQHKCSVLLFLALASAGITMAESRDYGFDKVHSQVIFQVSHLGFSQSEGEFHDVRGSFSFNPETWAESECDVRIGVASLDMDDTRWEKKMLGKDWFHVDQFPEMRFVCERFEQISEHQGKLRGQLTIRDISHPVTLEVTFNRAAIHKFSLKYIAGFSASGQIRRSDFGMLKYLPDIGDNITIQLEIEGIRKAK